MTGITQAMIYLARYSRFGLGVRWSHEAWSSCIPCVPQYVRPHLRLGRSGCKDLDGPYIFIKFLALQIILTPWSMVHKFNNFRFKKYSVIPIIQPNMQIQGLGTVGWVCVVHLDRKSWFGCSSGNWRIEKNLQIQTLLILWSWARPSQQFGPLIFIQSCICTCHQCTIDIIRWMR